MRQLEQVYAEARRRRPQGAPAPPPPIALARPTTEEVRACVLDTIRTSGGHHTEEEARTLDATILDVDVSAISTRGPNGDETIDVPMTIGVWVETKQLQDETRRRLAKIAGGDAASAVATMAIKIQGMRCGTDETDQGNASVAEDLQWALLATGIGRTWPMPHGTWTLSPGARTGRMHDGEMTVHGVLTGGAAFTDQARSNARRLREQYAQAALSAMMAGTRLRIDARALGESVAGQSRQWELDESVLPGTMRTGWTWEAATIVHIEPNAGTVMTVRRARKVVARNRAKLREIKAKREITLARIEAARRERAQCREATRT